MAPRCRPALLLAAVGLLTLLPQGLLGKSGTESSAALLRRTKRGWVWNQFFVLEEYTGLEGLYIGKVSGPGVNSPKGVLTFLLLMEVPGTSV